MSEYFLAGVEKNSLSYLTVLQFYFKHKIVTICENRNEKEKK